MPKQRTQTDIVNQALARLGSTQRVSSINETSEVAKDAATHWDAVLLYLTAEHPFNFAIERDILPETGTPQHGWKRSFDLPPDCLRFLPPRPADDVYFECEVEGRAILTDSEAPLPIRYLSSSKIDDTTRWPPYFALAVEVELAARMAEAVTGSTSIATKMADMAFDKLKNAKRRDGLESGRAKRSGAYARGSWSGATRGYRRESDDPRFRGVL
tara:strand:+ start:2023 stop:2664 length:642 start_codon:yes stop_codon:yes gene_type:complete